MSENQCPHQWIGNGCGRSAGHEGNHYGAARGAGWADRATDKRGPWEVCGAAHPTAGVTCYCVKGHKGKHYALTVPMPEGEPTKFEAHPFVEWRRS